MSDINNPSEIPPDSEKKPAGLLNWNHFLYAGIFCVLSTLLYFIVAGFSAENLDTLALIYLKKTTTLVLFIFFTLFWRTKFYDTDWRIFREPIAIAIYMAGVAIAIGFSQ